MASLNKWMATVNETVSNKASAAKQFEAMCQMVLKSAGHKQSKRARRWLYRVVAGNYLISKNPAIILFGDVAGIEIVEA